MSRTSSSLIADVLRGKVGPTKVSISVSGGKDSQAMLVKVRQMFLQHVFEEIDLSAVHADLGRAEWPQTPAFVEKIVDDQGLPLHIVRRTKGDLVSRIEERLHSVSTVDPTRPAKPFWPSAAQRYCTSDLKRDPIAKHHRWLLKEGVLVSCIGMRSEESTRRAKLPEWSVNRRVSSQKYKRLEVHEAILQYNGGRLVLDWLPIHSMRLPDVWKTLGTSVEDLEKRRVLYKAGREEEALQGWPAHPAYVFGNERLSCALCVLASVNDLKNGKKHHPELYQIYVDLEKKSTYTFRDGFSLSQLE